MLDPIQPPKSNPRLLRSLAARAAVAALSGSFIGEIAFPRAAEAWLASVGLIVAFCGALGIAINGRAAGLLIDERNRMSLSRLQACAWSVLVLSAVLTAIAFRIRTGIPDPISVGIPAELLAAMGISGASLAVSPAALRLKAVQSPPAGLTAHTAAQLGDIAEAAPCQGLLYTRSSASGARWLDLFRGDEVCNAAAPDLSKVQHFLVSAIVIAAYAAGLWSAFCDPKRLAALPGFDPNLVWLMGLSHAGYLAYKAAPHGPPAIGPADAPAVG